MIDDTEQAPAEPTAPTLPAIRGTMTFGDGKTYLYTNSGGKSRALMLEGADEESNVTYYISDNDFRGDVGT